MSGLQRCPPREISLYSLLRKDKDYQLVVHSYCNSCASVCFTLSRIYYAGLLRNFQKFSHAQVDRLGAPYDVTSLMHLHRKSWSRNGLNTIEARAGAGVPLGRRDGLSVIDKQQINQLYKCSNNRGEWNNI